MSAEAPSSAYTWRYKMLKTTKQCTQCKTIKNISEFYKRKQGKKGIISHCKKCANKRSKEYNHSKKGLLSLIYSRQKSNSIERGHDLPTYTKIELYDWLFSQKKFHILYDNWKRLDYQKDYVPSVDRKDDYIGYTMNNIQLMTWRENNEKNYMSRKDGTNNKHNTAIIQYTKEMFFVSEYHSVAFASRQTGINAGNIYSVCNKERRTAGGFIWRFKI